jgi:hypothetical protein
MSCLGARLYDPATAAVKTCSTAIAMTAIDTANLRISFPVPPSGMVLVKEGVTLHGATTYPQVLLGVLDGSQVISRIPPVLGGGNIAATTLMRAEISYVVSGLTPGSTTTWDAAYGVETTTAASALKFGGANTGTANNAFGAFQFEIWQA